MLATAMILTLFCGGAAWAADAILSWSPNLESDLAGYRVHYGTASRSYTTVIDVGLATTYTVTGLGPGTYYFALTAYNRTGAESGFSSEVSKVIADTVSPVISSVAAGSITSSSATITWTTSEPATSLVEYGTSTAYGLQTTENSVLAGSHQHLLTGLQASTLYHYRVLSRDAAGNVSVSADRTLTTSAPAPADTTPPTISAVAAVTVTSGSATIAWTTNEAATTQVQYGTTTAYGSTTSLNSTLLTTHSQALSGLAASTTYNFRVLSRDAAGNLATSGNFTFRTLAAADTTRPTISSVAATNVTSTGATVTWTTNEAATTQVQYGTTTAYGSTTSLNSTLLTAHSQSLTGLTAATLYHYRVLSRDAADNLATSADFTVTTLPAPDTTPPTISAVAATNVTSSSATITWATNEAATTQVTYGTTTTYGSSTPLNSTLVTAHSQNLSGLAAATVYHFRVVSRDAAGNQAISGDITLTTLAAEPATDSSSSDTTAPIISRINVRATTTSAQIGWRTNEAATSVVEYGTTTAYGSSSAMDATLVQRHRQSLNGLTPTTTYHFRVRSIDAVGKPHDVAGSNLQHVEWQVDDFTAATVPVTYARQTAVQCECVGRSSCAWFAAR
ncbi:MAG: fibronectin type III domain-containing protein [Nitrospirota bacterium]